jgi:hypothetical protein
LNINTPLFFVFLLKRDYLVSPSVFSGASFSGACAGRPKNPEKTLQKVLRNRKRVVDLRPASVATVRRGEFIARGSGRCPAGGKGRKKIIFRKMLAGSKKVPTFAAA